MQYSCTHFMNYKDRKHLFSSEYICYIPWLLPRIHEWVAYYLHLIAYFQTSFMPSGCIFGISSKYHYQGTHGGVLMQIHLLWLRRVLSHLVTWAFGIWIDWGYCSTEGYQLVNVCVCMRVHVCVCLWGNNVVPSWPCIPVNSLSMLLAIVLNWW